MARSLGRSLESWTASSQALVSVKALVLEPIVELEQDDACSWRLTPHIREYDDLQYGNKHIPFLNSDWKTKTSFLKENRKRVD